MSETFLRRRSRLDLRAARVLNVERGTRDEGSRCLRARCAVRSRKRSGRGCVSLRRARLAVPFHVLEMENTARLWREADTAALAQRRNGRACSWPQLIGHRDETVNLVIHRHPSRCLTINLKSMFGRHQRRRRDHAKAIQKALIAN